MKKSDIEITAKEVRIIFVSVFLLLSTIIWSQNLDHKTITIAGLQMNVSTDIELNKATIIENIEKAANSNARFLVTPEGSLSGYHNKFDQKKLDKALQEILETAKKNRIGLFLGTCFYEQDGDKEYCYNQVRVYSPSGEYLGAQAKYLLCSSLEYPGTGEMNDYVQGNTKIIEFENIKFGILICNDLWASPGYTTIPNPYLPLKLKQLGAEVIIHAINTGTNLKNKKFNESSAEQWARAIQIPIMEVNAAKGEKTLNASSGLINKYGDRINGVPDVGEQLFYCEIKIND